MDTKFLTIGFLITATLFTLGSSCGKDNGSKPCKSGRYSFNVTSEFSPQKEVYNIGDTITLNSSFAKTLYDNISLQNIDYSNAISIVCPFGAALLDSLNHIIIPSIDSFNLINKIGVIKDDTGSPKGIRSFYFNESSGLYEMKIYIIPQKKGNYQIGLNDGGSQGIRGQDCTNAGFYMKILNSNKHLNILSNAAIPGVILDQYLVDKIYCFRVQ